MNHLHLALTLSSAEQRKALTMGKGIPAFSALLISQPQVSERPGISEITTANNLCVVSFYLSQRIARLLGSEGRLILMLDPY